MNALRITTLLLAGSLLAGCDASSLVHDLFDDRGSSSREAEPGDDHGGRHDDTGYDDNGGDDTGSDDTGFDDNGGDDTGSDDTGTDDNGGDDGSDDSGSDSEDDDEEDSCDHHGDCDDDSGSSDD